MEAKQRNTDQRIQIQYHFYCTWLCLFSLNTFRLFSINTLCIFLATNTIYLLNILLIFVDSTFDYLFDLTMEQQQYPLYGMPAAAGPGWEQRLGIGEGAAGEERQQFAAAQGQPSAVTPQGGLLVLSVTGPTNPHASRENER